MKKVIAILFGIVSIIIYLVTFNIQNREEFSKIKKMEINSKSYCINIDKEIDTKSADEAYTSIIDIVNKYDGSIYYNKIDFDNEDTILTKYHYSRDTEFFKSLDLKRGEYIGNNENAFIATYETGDSKQIGLMNDFGNDNKIKVSHMKNAIGKVSLGGDYIINLKNRENIDNFIGELKDKLDVSIEKKELVFSDAIDNSIYSYLYGGIVALYIVIILLIFYKLINSYKEISIKKMMGYTSYTIWFKDIREIIFIQLGVNIIINSILSFILINSYSESINKFIFKILIAMVSQVGLTIILLSLPYIYTKKINVASSIKNKNPINIIITFNHLIKSIIIIIVILIASNLGSEYASIKTFYETSLKQWEATKNYLYIGSITDIEESEYFSDEFALKLKELYITLNREGSILADFDEYMKMEEEVILRPKVIKSIGTVNPNYLHENILYDINGKKIQVSEDKEILPIIVPYRYKENKEEIIKFFDDTDTEIEIIWSKDNQKVFTYNIDIRPEEGNIIIDPIIAVLTEKNGHFQEYGRVAGEVGRPFKIKIKDKDNPYGVIKGKTKELGIEEYLDEIYLVYDEVAITIQETKQKLQLIGTSIIALLVLVGIIIIQNIYNYLEQEKVALAIKTLNGYKHFDKYRDYYSKMLYWWLSIVIALQIIPIRNGDNIFIVSLLALTFEVIVSKIWFSINEYNKILKVIKRG